LGSIFAVDRKNIKKMIRIKRSNIRSATTVAKPVEKGTVSFFFKITGLAISPTLPGRMQFIMKPIIKG
jgi:hypothetical protein